MFEFLTLNEDLNSALEARTPEQQARKKEFLESRIERRWNFNKNSASRSKSQLESIKKSFETILKKIENKTFDRSKFDVLPGTIQMVDSKLMLEGLSQIKDLSVVFEEIASKPPSDERTNLVNFKQDEIKSLNKHAPAYAFSQYKVYADFMVNRSLIQKNMPISKLGYKESFIEDLQNAINETSEFIKIMEKHEDLIHKLGSEIVEVLMGPKQADYIHARRGYELVCTLWTSILTLAPFQYLSMALSIASKVANCYS